MIISVIRKWQNESSCSGLCDTFNLTTTREVRKRESDCSLFTTVTAFIRSFSHKQTKKKHDFGCKRLLINSFMQNNVVTNTRRTAPHTDVIHWSTCKCTRSIYHSSGQHRDISAIHLSAHWHQKDPVPPLRPEIYDEPKRREDASVYVLE